MKAIYIFTALASLAAAAPQNPNNSTISTTSTATSTVIEAPTETQEVAAIATEYFEARVNYPANGNINGKAITGNGLALWIGKPESRYCPPNVRASNGCHNGVGTSFTYPGGGSLYMGTAVPYGQEVFVNPSNAGVHYAQAHPTQSGTGNVHGGILTGWSYTVGSNGQGTLSWNRGLYACSSGANVWEIYAGVVGVNLLAQSCLGPFSLSTTSTSGPTAYEFT